MRVVHADSLVEGSDYEFVVNLFLAILGRWPDEEGYRHYVERVRDAPERRRDAIREIAASAEAVQYGTVIEYGDEPAAAPPPADAVPVTAELAAAVHRARDDLAALQTYVGVTLRQSLRDYLREVRTTETPAFEDRLRALEAQVPPAPTAEGAAPPS